jgi:amidase
VRDAAGVLDAVAGAGVGDPYTAPPPARPWRDEVGADPGRLRVGFRTDVLAGDGGGPAHPECVAAVERTVALLETLGHDVAPDSPAALDASGLDQFALVLSTAVARDLDRWSERLGRADRPIGDDEVEPFTAMLAGLGRHVSAVQYATGIERLQGWARGVATWWEEHDLLVLPTSPELPFELGAYDPNRDPMNAGRMGRLVTFTAPFNATGQPAISLPLHWASTPGGATLPVGVQLVAAYGREDVLLRVAACCSAPGGRRSRSRASRVVWASRPPR